MPWKTTGAIIKTGLSSAVFANETMLSAEWAETLKKSMLQESGRLENMKKNILFHTNFLVCAVIVLGFVATAVIGYQSNQGIFRKDVENVTILTSEGIYHQIDTIFSKPMNISMTMANDNLLKDFLDGEAEHLEDAEYVEMMRGYLNAYREKYGYDSVFLVSAKTNRYYHFNGIDRTLTPDNPENVWYYDFLDGQKEYDLNIDNDEATDNEITVFINCRIVDPAGGTQGVVGVGFRVDYLQALFKTYTDHYGVRVSLVNGTGALQISSEQTSFEGSSLLDLAAYPAIEDVILEQDDVANTEWYTTENGSGFVVGRYIPALNWHLVVENDTTALNRELAQQFTGELLIIVIIIIVVLMIITKVIRNYNAMIIELTVAREQEHQAVFQKATEQFYENIYEVDVTHDRAASDATEAYFESLGAPQGTRYSQALQIVAQKQIKEEFREGYLSTFAPENVLKVYGEGTENLYYDFMISADGTTYYWMRITAHIFYWEDDQSVRMLIYRQNIDAEKRREQFLYDKMQKDSLTGVYNKVATQEQIRSALSKEPDGRFAFLILDIDCFKAVNDRFGHAAGDKVLLAFSKTLKSLFREEDVVGRIGGDEFVAFLPVPDRETAERKAQALVAALHQQVETDTGNCEITTSIGVALSPEAGNDFETLYKKADAALYKTKERGKNGYSIY